MKEYYKETIDWSKVKKFDPIERRFGDGESQLYYFYGKDGDVIKYLHSTRSEPESVSFKYCRPLDKSCITREVDWSKVPVDAKVIDLTTDEKTRYHFSGYYEDKKEVHLFKNGKSSWTNGDQNTFWLRRDEVELIDDDNVPEK